MWASAFSPLIMFMKKTLKFLLKRSEGLSCLFLDQIWALLRRKYCADCLWTSVNIDLLTKSNGVLQRFQSTLNFFSLGKKRYFYHA